MQGTACNRHCRSDASRHRRNGIEEQTIKQSTRQNVSCDAKTNPNSERSGSAAAVVVVVGWWWVLVVVWVTNLNFTEDIVLKHLI